MSLAFVLLVLAAFAAAQAISSLVTADPHADLATMASILAIAIALAILGLGSAASLAVDAPPG